MAPSSRTRNLSVLLLCVSLAPLALVHTLSLQANQCGRQLRRAKEILESLDSEALLLPVSGYLPSAPPWLRSSWASYLAELSDESLAHAEDRGLVDLLLQDSSAPSTLRDTGSALHDLNGQLPVLASGDGAQSTSYGVRKSKVQQVDCFLRAAQRCRKHCGEDVGRIVDVGSGLGALTRHLAQHLALPCLGTL
ncbi:unnamed protein product, partial [Durusdinium trenchii]